MVVRGICTDLLKSDYVQNHHPFMIVTLNCSTIITNHHPLFLISPHMWNQLPAFFIPSTSTVRSAPPKQIKLPESESTYRWVDLTCWLFTMTRSQDRRTSRRHRLVVNPHVNQPTCSDVLTVTELHEAIPPDWMTERPGLIEKWNN